MLVEKIYNISLKSNEIVVLIYLVNVLRYENKYPSRALIAKKCGMKSMITLDRVLKSLEKKNIISISKRNSSLKNFYHINYNTIDSLLDKDFKKNNDLVLSDYIKEVLDSKDMI